MDYKYSTHVNLGNRRNTYREVNRRDIKFVRDKGTGTRCPEKPHELE